MFESFLKPTITTQTVSGSVCTFNSQYALPLASHKIALTATQSGSGTPSPSNPRPISGYSAINISHSDADTSNPTVYTIQIGSTVYGGEYDARTGVFVATSAGVDLGSITWTNNSTYFLGNFSGKGAKPPLNSLTPFNGLCECYKVSFLNDTSGNIITMSNNGLSIYTRDNAHASDSGADYATYLSGKMLVYELATPIEIQLPPCPIDTLEGVNNIWADTGNTTLQYPKFG